MTATMGTPPAPSSSSTTPSSSTSTSASSAAPDSFSVAALKAALTAYRNPILPGWNPDPTVCNVPGKGYFLATGSGEYSPGLPVYHSIDLFTWELLGHAIKRVPAALGAPTLRYHAGHHYMVVTAAAAADSTHPQILLVSTPDIFDEARWGEPVVIEASGTEPDLLFDDDMAYLSYTSPSSTERLIVSIDIDTGRNLSQPKVLEHQGRLLKRAGWYYLLTSSDDDASASVYRSRELGMEADDGEPQWEGAPRNPILANGDHADVRGTARLDIVRGERGWSAIFRAMRSRSARGSRAGSAAGVSTPSSSASATSRPTATGADAETSAHAWSDSHLGAETYMAPVEWRDGWPVINGGEHIELVGNAEGMRLLPERDEWVDEFEREDLSIGWYQARKPSYTLGQRGLALVPAPLDSATPPPMLLQRQLGFDMDWETRVAIPTTPIEAGTVLCAGPSWAGVAVRGGSAPTIVFRSASASASSSHEPTTTAPLVLDTAGLQVSVVLRIRARRDAYEFVYVTAGTGGGEVVLGSVASEEFAVAGSGVHLGVYAVRTEGEGGEGAEEACFAYTKWARVEV